MGIILLPQEGKGAWLEASNATARTGLGCWTPMHRGFKFRVQGQGSPHLKTFSRASQ